MPIMLKLILEQHTKSINDIKGLIPSMVLAAQNEYDEWDQSDPENDWLNGGGICQEIAEAIAGVLNNHGIEAMTVDSDGMGEQHVWTVVRVVEGIFGVDIDPLKYETGGGYTWKKRPGIKFDNRSIDIYQMDDVDWDEMGKY